MKIARVLLCLLAVLLLADQARAAVITINSTDAADTPDYDLTNVYGLNDWAYWSQTGGSLNTPLASPLAPSNSKLDASAIGSITHYGGTGTRGSSAPTKPPYDFVFADGTSPLSGTVENLIGIFNTTLGTDAIGKGVQLDVTAPSAGPFAIYVWATSFNAASTLTVTAGTDVDSETFPAQTAGSRSPGKLFTINIAPDSTGQSFNIRLVQTSSSDDFSNVSISAVAVAVPEPSSALLIMGLSSFALVRRRSRA